MGSGTQASYILLFRHHGASGSWPKVADQMVADHHYISDPTRQEGEINGRAVSPIQSHVGL